MDGILDAFPDGLRFRIRSMTAEDDRVAVEAESEGVHASGRPYRNQYHFLMVIRDGKVRQLKEYLDTMHAQEVLVEGAAALES
jgi:ketosteroid isomerase-like protein